MMSFVMTAIDCGLLPVPDNGVIRYLSGTKPGNIAEYVCNDGFQLVGDGFRDCLTTGLWSGVAPTCEHIISKTLVIIQKRGSDFFHVSVLDGYIIIENSW